MYTLDTPDPGFVVNVLWTVTGVDGQHTASIDGNSQFTMQEGTFTPYDQLTQDEVLGWIWANGVDKDATEAAVNAQIQAQAFPTIVSPPLPWAA